MAANFGYNEQYVDEMLDMERLFAHLEYLRDNPPAGTLIKAYFEAQSGSGGRHSSPTVSKPVKRTFASEDERKNFERKQINNLCADFGVNINNLQKMPPRRMRVLPSQRKKGGK
jgi:hypothetical protein